MPAATTSTMNSMADSTGCGPEAYCPLRISGVCHSPQMMPLTRIGAGMPPATRRRQHVAAPADLLARRRFAAQHASDGEEEEQPLGEARQRRAAHADAEKYAGGFRRIELRQAGVPRDRHTPPTQRSTAVPSPPESRACLPSLPSGRKCRAATRASPDERRRMRPLPTTSARKCSPGDAQWNHPARTPCVRSTPTPRSARRRKWQAHGGL